MTTLSIKINQKSKNGKAFINLIQTSLSKNEEVNSVLFEEESSDESPYNLEFVKMVLEAEKRGNYTTLDPSDLWGSLGLK
jgi:hypothetical protein